jgi:hypothetical protein
MSCRHRAVLIVTRDVEGTSTSVARERKNLSCSREASHQGTHRDRQYEEEWEDKGPLLSHVLRHDAD